LRRFLPVIVLAIAACSSGTKSAKTAATTGLPGMDADAARKGVFARLVTHRGDILVKLYREDTPKAVENFIALAKGSKQWRHPETGRASNRPLYDGTQFFRVIPGVLIQGGDPANAGYGGPGYTIVDEISPGRTFSRPGMVGMASGAKDGGGSQFFITLTELPWLNDKHTIFGEVVEGLDIVEAIAAVPRRQVDAATGREIDRPRKRQLLKAVRIEER
jgi:peptidyl-prolyl cis-trans isomerase A (cyclophilin A)